MDSITCDARTDHGTDADGARDSVPGDLYANELEGDTADTISNEANAEVRLDETVIDVADSYSATDAPDDKDAANPDLFQEICGTPNDDTEHMIGQPCQAEGESYCADDESYVYDLAVAGLYCMRPGFIECTRNSDDSLTWHRKNCDKTLIEDHPDCKSVFTLARCIQGNKKASCCPVDSETNGAGVGTMCDGVDRGKSICRQAGGNGDDGVLTCNFLDDAAPIFPEELQDTRYPSSACDHIFAECTYWYYSDVCDELDCNHPTACMSGFDEFGEPCKECPGQCIVDTVQWLNRCAATCKDLDDFYVDM